MDDQAWELASVIARNETRATTIVAALAESQSVSLSSLPLSAYTAEIRRDWRESGKSTDPATLEDDLTVIFDRLGTAVRTAVARGRLGLGRSPAELVCAVARAHAQRAPRQRLSLTGPRSDG